jgi:hypothetical protein
LYRKFGIRSTDTAARHMSVMSVDEHNGKGLGEPVSTFNV